jgi:hypothetical protein
MPATRGLTKNGRIILDGHGPRPTAAAAWREDRARPTDGGGHAGPGGGTLDRRSWRQFLLGQKGIVSGCNTYPRSVTHTKSNNSLYNKFL